MSSEANVIFPPVRPMLLQPQRRRACLFDSRRAAMRVQQCGIRPGDCTNSFYFQGDVGSAAWRLSLNCNYARPINDRHARYSVPLPRTGSSQKRLCKQQTLPRGQFLGTLGPRRPANRRRAWHSWKENFGYACGWFCCRPVSGMIRPAAGSFFIRNARANARERFSQHGRGYAAFFLAANAVQ